MCLKYIPVLTRRSALEEVKTDLQERSSRWHQIEKICGFSVVSNPGLDFLDSVLRAPSGSVSCKACLGVGFGITVTLKVSQSKKKKKKKKCE